MKCSMMLTALIGASVLAMPLQQKTSLMARRNEISHLNQARIDGCTKTCGSQKNCNAFEILSNGDAKITCNDKRTIVVKRGSSSSSSSHSWSTSSSNGDGGHRHHNHDDNDDDDDDDNSRSRSSHRHDDDDDDDDNDDRRTSSSQDNDNNSGSRTSNSSNNDDEDDNNSSSSSSSGSGSPSSGTSGGWLPESDYKSQMLQAHNDARAKHDTGALRWSENLVQTSKVSLRGCPYDKNHHNQDGIGENKGYNSKFDPYNWVMTSWVTEEYKYWDFGSSTKVGDGASGHMTQVLWKDTTEVGCAVMKCSRYYYYLCNYNPRGNMNYSKGEYADNVLPK